MRQVKCRICNKIFETNQPRACYCSPVCAVAGAKLLREKWNKKHPDYQKLYRGLRAHGST